MRDSVVKNIVIDMQDHLNHLRLTAKLHPEEYARVCELLIPELKARWRVAKNIVDKEVSR